MCFEVSDGSNSAMILGDAIGNNHVAFARPDWRSGSDQDPGGLGHVEKSGDSYKYVEDAT